MNLPDFLIDSPDGEIHLTGHRIGLYHFVYHDNEGYSPSLATCPNCLCAPRTRPSCAGSSARDTSSCRTT